MNKEQLRLLNRMKKLIRDGKKKFILRKDRNYIEDLRNLGITERDAWIHIMSLNQNLFFIDSRYSLTSNNDALVFKKMINKKIAYIKIKIESNNGEETVCLSFHEDRR